MIFIFQFFFGKLLDGEYGDGIHHKSDHCVDDCNISPTFHTAAAPVNGFHSYRLDQEACAECEDKADGTHLYSLVAVFGDECGQCRIGDVVCGVEYGIEQCVGDEEICIFCDIPPCCRNCKNCSQHHTAADVGKQHPRTSLAELRFGFVNQRTEYDICKSVKNF